MQTCCRITRVSQGSLTTLECPQASANVLTATDGVSTCCTDNAVTTAACGIQSTTKNQFGSGNSAPWPFAGIACDAWTATQWPTPCMEEHLRYHHSPHTHGIQAMHPCLNGLCLARAMNGPCLAGNVALTHVEHVAMIRVIRTLGSPVVLGMMHWWN